IISPDYIPFPLHGPVKAPTNTTDTSLWQAAIHNVLQQGRVQPARVLALHGRLQQLHDGVRVVELLQRIGQQQHGMRGRLLRAAVERHCHGGQGQGPGGLLPETRAAVGAEAADAQHWDRVPCRDSRRELDGRGV
ncbi:hypothetical protein E4U21_005799, partial [Claviceps maximensis]